jgi:predicted kinase
VGDTDQIKRPLLIVVTGQPGSGKTSLTHTLARAIRCPAICRDEIKEGLLNTIGETGKAENDITRQVYDLFFETVQLLLSHQVSLVAEAAFQHKVWAPKLEPLRAIGDIRIVVCAIDPELARARRMARVIADPDRERFHPDRDVPIQNYDAPHLDVPTLTVDTSDGYRPAFERIVSFVSA